MTSASSLTGLRSTPVAFSIFCGGGAARHLRRADDDLQVRLGEVRERGDARGVARGGGDLAGRSWRRSSASPAARPASVTVFMVASRRRRRRRPGRRCDCWARSDEPAKFNLTSTPGWSVSNCFSRPVKVAVSEAAARTVSVRASGGADGAADGAAPRPNRRRSRRAAARQPAAASRRTLTTLLRGSRPRRWST